MTIKQDLHISTTVVEAEQSPGQNPFLFAVGCPRSGTTLLQRMLNHHPMLAVANDTHFIPRAIEDLTDGADLPLNSEIVERVRNYRRYPRLGLPDGALDEAAGQAQTYSDLVSGLYSAYARLHDKPLAGEKTPDYVRYLPLLHKLFPAAKSIHIIRDGRDVALSTLEWAHEGKGPGRFQLWQQEPVAVCALWWRWQVSSGWRDGIKLGPSRYHEIHYEALVAQPEETVREITTFLELPFAAEMLTYYAGKTHHNPDLSSKKQWLPPTSGLRDWRSQMKERDAALFEALAGDILSALGYEPGPLTNSPEINAVAERCWAWWQEEMERREAKKAQKKS